MKILHKITGAVLFDGDKSILSDVDLSNANLYGANLSNANLSGANLSNANLYGANLSGANLSGANLSNAILSGVDLSDVDLSDAILSGVNLSNANLSNANLYGANLSNANLNGEILKKSPLIIIGLYWWTMVTGEYLTIGCQRHTHAEWAAFSDADIVRMDSQALRFWRAWRDPLLAMCAAHSVE